MADNDHPSIKGMAGSTIGQTYLTKSIRSPSYALASSFSRSLRVARETRWICSDRRYSVILGIYLSRLNFANLPRQTGFHEIFVGRGRGSIMNKNQLLMLKEGVEQVIYERRAVGEYNADSKHMLFLLSNMLALIDHAISQAKPEKK